FRSGLGRIGRPGAIIAGINAAIAAAFVGIDAFDAVQSEVAGVGGVAGVVGMIQKQAAGDSIHRKVEFLRLPNEVGWIKSVERNRGGANQALGVLHGDVSD